LNKNHLIALLLSVCLSLSCIPAHAAEQPVQSEDTSTTSIKEANAPTAAFNHSEIDAVLAGTQDGPITIENIKSLLDLSIDDLIKDDQEYATVEDFLYLFILKYSQRFISYNGEQFLYPAEDSMWLSTDEWTYLINHIDEPIRRSSVLIILERTQKSIDYLQSRFLPDTYERYKEIVDAFYPEFSPFVAENKEAVEFWIKPFSPTGSSNYLKTYFSTLLHELQHEISAKKSNTFDKRGIVGSSWAVYSRKPATYYYYNIAEKEWVAIDPVSVPNSSSLIGKCASDAVKSTSLYQQYYGGSSSANNWGLYGMLLEFASSEITLRADVLSTSIGYHYKEVPALTQELCFFWEGSVLHYLAGLKEQKPEIYEDIMADTQLLQLIQDFCSYTKEQLYLAPSVNKDSDSLKVIRDWANDNVSRAQKAEISNILNNAKAE